MGMRVCPNDHHHGDRNGRSSDGNLNENVVWQLLLGNRHTFVTTQLYLEY